MTEFDVVTVLLLIYAAVQRKSEQYPKWDAIEVTSL